MSSLSRSSVLNPPDLPPETLSSENGPDSEKKPEIPKSCRLGKYGALWFLVLAAALILRIAFAFYWQEHITAPSEKGKLSSRDGSFFFGDSDSYWKLGRQLAFGRPYEFDEQRHWTYFRMPGYPALLVPLFRIGGENPPVLAARCLNCLFGVCTVALTGWLAYLLFQNQIIALLAAFAAAVEPFSVVQSVLILAEEPFVSAMLMQIILFVLFIKNFQERFAGYALFFGLFSAWTVYFRPSWYYFPVFLFCWGLLFLFAQKRFFSSLIRYGAFFLLAGIVFCLCLSPWWIRNYRLSGQFIPTTLQMGASLYDGLSPQATGSSNMEFIDAFRREEELSGSDSREPFEVRLDRRLKKASLDWSRENPGQVVWLAGIKFFRLWNPVPNEPAFSSFKIRIILFFTSVPLMILGIAGFISTLKKGTIYGVLWLPAVYLTGLHVIFVSSVRYRMPAMYGFMIAAAWILWKILQSRGGGLEKVPKSG
ncbi:MAG: phospholipid carrier-dependent glycosyltransferase [Planctomycetia bacterium]|nr:phospholipid carrier-dependent glycosyltransferase [Planctomycetia bacterium]